MVLMLDHYSQSLLSPRSGNEGGFGLGLGLTSRGLSDLGSGLGLGLNLNLNGGRRLTSCSLSTFIWGFCSSAQKRRTKKIKNPITINFINNKFVIEKSKQNNFIENKEII